MIRSKINPMTVESQRVRTILLTSSMIWYLLELELLSMAQEIVSESLFLLWKIKPCSKSLQKVNFFFQKWIQEGNQSKDVRRRYGGDPLEIKTWERSSVANRTRCSTLLFLLYFLILNRKSTISKTQNFKETRKIFPSFPPNSIRIKQ